MMNLPLIINCNGRLLNLEIPIVMGILNVTPDSFFDGGKFNSIDTALFQTEKMLEEGATIVDVGGMSSRPGAEIISEEEELRRIVPIVTAIHEKFPDALLSIDTVRSKVAKAAIQAGGHLVNDISAGQFDNELYRTVGELGVPYVLMHMQGSPKTMQYNPTYKDIISDLMDFFVLEIPKLRKFGVKDIIIDVGFGFGKTVENNYVLLKKMKEFEVLGLPLLAGVSRKSMICKVLNINPLDALNGTTALHVFALQNGAKILRVHDVKEATQVIQLWQQLERV